MHEQNIKDTEDEIARIMEDETYHTISELDDFDGYFSGLKSDLETQKEKLEEEARILEEEPLETTTFTKPPKKIK